MFLSPVLKRQVSPEELQTPGGPFLKKTFTVNTVNTHAHKYMNSTQYCVSLTPQFASDGGDCHLVPNEDQLDLSGCRHHNWNNIK